MKSKVLWCSLVVAVFATAVYAGSVFATPSASLGTTTVARSPFDPIDLNARAKLPDFWKARLKTKGITDVYVIRNTLAAKTDTTPAGTTGWHSHPGPSLILVTQGTVTNYTADNCGGQQYSAGAGFIDPGGDNVHMLRNDGTMPAETIAVQFIPSRVDRKIDEPAPRNCDQ